MSSNLLTVKTQKKSVQISVSPRVRQAAQASARARSPRLQNKEQSLKKGSRSSRFTQRPKIKFASSSCAITKPNSHVRKKMGNNNLKQQRSKLRNNKSFMTDKTSLVRAIKRAEALDLAQKRQLRQNQQQKQKAPYTAPAKMQFEKLPSIFSRPKLNLNSGKNCGRRPKENVLLRNLPAMDSEL